MSEKDDGRPERPKIIPIFGKRTTSPDEIPEKRRLEDEEVQEWLRQAAAAPWWMITIWHGMPDGTFRYCRKNTDQFPHGKLREMFTELEKDSDIQAMIHRANIEARGHDRGFAAEEE